ncbi:hypothetical protein DC498_17825 [Terrimonas sp.]|nr:hypothetical protein DC498_17825 [Terrimonas sp.]
MIVPVTLHYKNNLFTIQREKNTFVLYRIKFRRQFAAAVEAWGFGDECQNVWSKWSGLFLFS